MEDGLKEHFQDFSTRYQVNIIQQTDINEDRINIYATNMMYDENLHLIEGTYPVGSEFISNRLDVGEEKNHSGLVAFPFTQIDVRFYDFSQVVNVGLGNTFHISGDENIVQVFLEEFSIYGATYFVQESIHPLNLINHPLLKLAVFSLITFVVVSFYMSVTNRQKMLIEELWGLSTKERFLSLLGAYVKFQLFVQIAILAGGIILLFAFHQHFFLFDYMKWLVLINLVLLIMIPGILFLTSQLTKKMDSVATGVRRKSFLQGSKWLSYGLKVVLTIFLTTFLVRTVQDLQILKNRVEGFGQLNQMENIFRVQVGIPREDLDNDLYADRRLNDRLVTFYHKIVERNSAFLMDSTQFTVIDYEDGQPFFLYRFWLESDEPAVLSRVVFIDENYLRKNPIEGYHGDIEQKMIHEPNVLNILVPQKLEGYEEEIIAEYLDWFYLQKVTVYNMYNEEIGLPLRKEQKEDLAVNFIYVENNQSYQTFQYFAGDFQNRVLDPIAIIVHDSLDSSVIGSMATSSLFFVDDSDGQAFENIRSSVEESGASEIRHVQSTFAEANQGVNRLRQSLLEQTIGATILVFLSALVIGIFVWSSYQLNIYERNIQYLFGYSYWQRNRREVALTVIASVVAGFITFFVFVSTWKVIVISLTLLSISISINLVMENQLMKRNVIKIVKEGHL